MRDWIVKYHFSRWMLIASMIIWMALLHPRLITYILAAVNCAVLFATLEFAHIEGRYRTKTCWLCLVVPIVIVAVAFWIIIKVNWLAM